VIHNRDMKITVKDIQRSANPIELFKSGCKTEATFREYEIMLKKFVNEFLEDLLSSNGYEARVNELVSRAKKDEQESKLIGYAKSGVTFGISNFYLHKLILGNIDILQKKFKTSKNS